MRLVLILFFLFLSSCESAPSALPADSVSAKKISTQEKTIADYVEILFPQNTWGGQWWYDKNQPDIHNGFARLAGNLEGKLQFYLFKGPEKNLVVKEMWGCGPMCEVTHDFYLFERGSDKYTTVTFTDLVDEKNKVALKHETSHCFQGQRRQVVKNNFKDVCWRHLKLPREGRDIVLYKLKYDAVEDDSPAKKIMTLRWNGKAFEITKEYSNAPWAPLKTTQ